MITKNKVLSEGQRREQHQASGHDGDGSPRSPAQTAKRARQHSPSDHATAAPTLVAATQRRRAGKTRHRYRQSAWALPRTAPSTAPANTIAKRVVVGFDGAAVTATPTAAGTVKPAASARVTSSTHRKSRLRVMALTPLTKSLQPRSWVEAEAKVPIRPSGE